MEQIFMLVFMVILIGIVIYFGIKENKETTKENNKIEEDPYRFSKKIRAIKEEYGEFNYIEQPAMKIGEWENEVRKNISSIVDTKTKYSSNKELRILVGDYNRASVSNTTSVLESVGLNVTIANSGIEIIERIKYCGQYIVDNAQNILGDEKYITNIDIICHFFDTSLPPYVTVNKDIIPNEYIEIMKENNIL